MPTKYLLAGFGGQKLQPDSREGGWDLLACSYRDHFILGDITVPVDVVALGPIL